MEIDITDSDFAEKVIVKSKEMPVLVDFWASWCGPCQMLAPILKKIADEYGDKIVVAKLNIEENKEKAQEYNVMSIPNVKLFKDGEVADEFTGVVPEEDIKKLIDANL
jgi:thioredoxin